MSDDKLRLPDAFEIAKKHFGSIVQDLPSEIRDAIEKTFKRQAEVIRERLYGVDVSESQAAILAQLKQIISGAAAKLSALEAHWWAAAQDYAEQLGEVALKFVSGLAVGAIK